MRGLLFLILMMTWIYPVWGQTAAPETSSRAPIEDQRIQVPNVPDKKAPQSTLSERAQQQAEEARKNLSSFREILILVSVNDKTDVTDVLKSRNLTLIENYSLRSLGLVLILTKGNVAILKDLRRLLPNADIDWNSDLSSARGPRLYAKDKIKWPDHGACLEQAIKIPIGMIDGHIIQSHPAFAGQNISEKSFVGNKNADNRHGTAIASILVGNAQQSGFDGLLKGAKIYNAVALRHTSDGQQLASTEAVLRSLDWLLLQDVRLINVSLAGEQNALLTRAVELALKNGALIFAAAGNNGPSAPPAYPAAINGVFAVTAIDANGKLYAQANTGRYIDLKAPGVDVWVAGFEDSQGSILGSYQSGTSYATPFALAAAALQLTRNSELSAALLSKILGQTVIANCP